MMVSTFSTMIATPSVAMKTVMALRPRNCSMSPKFSASPAAAPAAAAITAAAATFWWKIVCPE